MPIGTKRSLNNNHYYAFVCQNYHVSTYMIAKFPLAALQANVASLTSQHDVSIDPSHATTLHSSSIWWVPSFSPKTTTVQQLLHHTNLQVYLTHNSAPVASALKPEDLINTKLTKCNWLVHTKSLTMGRAVARIKALCGQMRLPA